MSFCLANILNGVIFNTSKLNYVRDLKQLPDVMMLQDVTWQSFSYVWLKSSLYVEILSIPPESLVYGTDGKDDMIF